MRTLVVYFSWTGNTQSLAQQIAAGCAADIEGLRQSKSAPSALRYLSSLWQAATHVRAPIEPLQHKPADYDLVVIGTPIWAWNMSSPVRAFIQQYQGQFRKLALFCTCSGAGQAKVLADMQALCAMTPIATLALTTNEMHDRFHHERLEKFLQQIQQVDTADVPAGLRPRPAF